MTFEQTIGHISDRFGQRVSVSVSGIMGDNGEQSVVMTVTGTLGPAFRMGEERAVEYANLAGDPTVVFGFEEFDKAVMFYFGPDEFRDAHVSGNTLRVWTGPDRTELSM